MRLVLKGFEAKSLGFFIVSAGFWDVARCFEVKEKGHGNRWERFSRGWASYSPNLHNVHPTPLLWKKKGGRVTVA